MSCLVFDAMGVIFRAADDVAELLFVDDRARNVETARAPGIESLLFDPDQGFDEVQGWTERHALAGGDQR